MFAKLPFIMVIAVAAGTSAPDFTGRWAGPATNTDGVAVPIYLTISKQGEVVSGHILRDDSNEVPLSDVVIRGDQVAFMITVKGVESTVKFGLKFVVFGHPLSDPQVALRGTSTTGRCQSTVDFYPVRVDFLGSNGVDFRPVVVHRVEPVYTEQARQANVHGTVLLRVEIEETGLISKEQIRVLRSLGHELDEAAVRCVGQWRFRPAFRNGYAVKSAASIEVAFRL
jgi:TonB family protein